MSLVLMLLGLGLLGLVAYEVYATILHGRARSGPVSEGLNRSAWWLARSVAFRLPRDRRHRILNSVGPLLLPALVAVLIILLIVGFALLYFPHMPDSFNVNPDAQSPAWIEAVYFSGITLTTLGYGDIAPRSTGMRLLALAEAATGFISISLAVTYLLAVTGALERKRAVALSFYHQAEQGADTAGFLLHHFVRGRFVALDTVLTQAARDLHAVLESHVEHPIVHYFHPLEVHKGLPRLLFISLDVCATVKGCLDEDTYPDLCMHPELRTLEESAQHMLRGMVRSLRLRPPEPDTALPASSLPTAAPSRQRLRYYQTMDRLRQAGVVVRQDVSAGLKSYRTSREEWEAQLGLLSAFLGYDWDEVTGDRGLDVAAEDTTEDLDA